MQNKLDTQPLSTPQIDGGSSSTQKVLATSGPSQYKEDSTVNEDNTQAKNLFAISNASEQQNIQTT